MKGHKGGQGDTEGLRKVQPREEEVALGYITLHREPTREFV